MKGEIPLTTLTTVQEQQIRRVRTANEAYRRAKRDALERARALAAEEIEDYRAAMDHEVRLAWESGIPKLVLRREGLGTTDSKTLEDSLGRTEGMKRTQTALEDEVLEVERYAFTGGLDQYGRREILVTMLGEDWDSWLAEKRTNRQLRQPDLVDANTGIFFEMEDGRIGTSIPDSSGAVMIDHPVVGWHKADRFRQINEWARAQEAAHE